MFQHDYIFKCLTTNDYMDAADVSHITLKIHAPFNYKNYSLMLFVSYSPTHAILPRCRYRLKLIMLYSCYVTQLLNTSAFIYLERMMPFDIIGYTAHHLNANLYFK